MDAVDIDDLVNYAESFIAQRLVDGILVQAVAAFPPLGWAFLNPISRQFIELGVNVGIKILDGMGFNINTDVITTDQGADWRKAAAVVLRLPDSVSDEEWEKAENEANHKFDELVRLTRTNKLRKQTT